MKTILALALLVGVGFGIVFCNSTAYYGWAPNRELIYRFESQVFTGIPNLKSQYAGLKLSSDVVVQTFSDYSVRIKFENPRFITVNEELRVSEGRAQIPKAQQELPDVLRKALTTPFVAHLKRGVVEGFFVEKSEPVVVTNIKKALLTQLQLDLTASRRQEVTEVQESNGVEKNEMSPKPAAEELAYFTTEESSVAGDCQTSYTVHPLPKYQAMEIERRISEAEQKLSEEGIIAGERSEGEQACKDKEYFEITKTKNFDNCKERPTYQSIRGMKTNCDFSKAECQELFTQMSASRYIVCGSPRDFIIREAATQNSIMTNPMGWITTPEKMTLNAAVTIMLLKVKSSGFQPLPKPQNPIEKRSLIYEFPQKSLWSTHETRDIAPRQETDKKGYQPILPMPDMKSGSSLVPSFIPFRELLQKIVQEMEKIVRELFKSPESCSAKSDVAGYVHAIAQSLRPLNLEELEEIEKSLMSASSSHQDKKIVKELWADILAMTGSNACISIIKRKLESGQLVGGQANRILQSALRNVKTPTTELLKEMLQLVKSLKSSQSERRDLYNTGLIQLSNLIQHACIDPTARITQFPVRTYGMFCNRDSEVIKREFIPYLVNELKNSGKDMERLVYISALGKIGDKDVLLPLIKVIEGSSSSPMTRSVAVYSLKRLAKLEPSVVRPLLLKMIDNPAENTEVRIAAISILPWTQPSTAQLQKIAVRSWFEPSRQVTSFLHSTFKSLSETKVPELLAVGMKARGLKTLVRPFQYGIQFSQSLHTQKFIEYLRTVSSGEAAYVNTAESIIPARISLSNQFFGGVWQIDGLTFSVYTSGMDALISKVGKYMYDNESSEEVTQELNKINEKLNIKGRSAKYQAPETFIRTSMLGFHRAYPVDNQIYAEIIDKASEELRRGLEGFYITGSFNMTYTNYIIKVRALLPSMAGFPILLRRNVPVVVGIQADYNIGPKNDGGIAKGKFITVINGKLQSSLGVLSPFSREGSFIGSGVEASLHYSMPLSFRAELEHKSDFLLSVETPEKYQKEMETIHAFVKPFTVVKSLEHLVPLNKAASFKEIVSGSPIKRFELPLGRSVGIDAKLKVEADYKRLDFPFVWEKLSQHNPLSALSLSFMPVSARLASVKLTYNPATSETKKFETRISLIHGKKLSESEMPEVVYPSQEEIAEGKEEELKGLCRSIEQTPQEVRLCEENVVERVQSRRETHKNARRMLERIASSGHVNGLNIEAAFHSETSRNAFKSQIILGSERKEREVESFLEVVLKTPERSAYEIEVDAVTKLPEMPYRWNIQELIKQNLKMENKIKIRFGMVNGEKHDVEVETVLSKSEQQKEAVRRSPELKKCEEEIAKGKEMSSVCIETRHQAASVDKVWMKVRVPESWKRSQLLNKVEAAAKAYFWQVMYEEIEYKQEQSGSSSLVYELDALFNRTGDVAQAWIKSPFSKIHIKNATIPYKLQGLLPISLRNAPALRLLQHVTRSQIPASCRVEDKEIVTFDNKTYKYELNECEHLLFKDCSSSGRRHIAVLAKKSSSHESRKNVKIIAGKYIVQLKWENEIEIVVNGKVEKVPAGGWYIKSSKMGDRKVVDLAIHRTRGDGVISVASPALGLEVFYDGKKVEVIARQLLHNKACGLCGDLNGESTADLKSAQECLMKKPRFSAYTYLVEDGRCGGVPSQEREEFEREKRECVKTHHISTPLKTLAENLLRRKIQPISTKHIVEVLENNVCISKSMIKLCGKGEKPVQVRQVELSFACLTRGYSRTHQILRRAEAGEEVLEVRDLPTEFSKKQVEAISCRPESLELEEEELERVNRFNERRNN